jgi:hypothetical protein
MEVGSIYTCCSHPLEVVWFLIVSKTDKLQQSRHLLPDQPSVPLTINININQPSTSTSTSPHLTHPPPTTLPTTPNPNHQNVLVKLGTTLPRQIPRQLFQTRNSHNLPTTQRIARSLETQFQIQQSPAAEPHRIRSYRNNHHVRCSLRLCVGLDDLF